MWYPTLRLRKIAKILVELVQLFVLGLISAGCILRLGNMQLDGLVQLGAVVLALLYAFTSLTFNRARAFPNGPSQRRALYAADLAFGATLSCTFGTSIAVVAYFLFSKSGYVPTPPDDWPSQLLPGFFAFVPLAFFLHTCVSAFAATRILIYGRFRFVRTRAWLRENKPRRSRSEV